MSNQITMPGTDRKSVKQLADQLRDFADKLEAGEFKDGVQRVEIFHSLPTYEWGSIASRHPTGTTILISTLPLAEFSRRLHSELNGISR